MTTRIELTSRLPLVCLGLVLLAALFLPDRLWNTLLVGLGGMFVVAYLWVRLLGDGLHARRHLRFGWVAVGDRLSEGFELRNDSPLPALWVEVIDESNVPGYEVAVVRSVGIGYTDRWRQSAICQQRGQFRLGPWSIRSSDPFGFFTVTQHYPLAEEIVIHPPIHGDLPIALPAGQSSGRQQVRQRSWQATINAATIRDYQPSDPMGWIHWPSSARTGRLLVRQFDLDVSGDVWFLLDMQAWVQLGEGVKGTEEHAVLLAASLATQALMKNRAVGVAGYGQVPQVVAPVQGRGQQGRILRALAMVQANGTVTLQTAMQDLRHVAKRGTTAVLITPDLDLDWLPGLVTLTRRGIRGHVVLLDRASFGGEGNSEGARDAVRRLGFGCDVVRQGEVGIPLEEQERRGVWEFRVTGTGKVVVVKSAHD